MIGGWYVSGNVLALRVVRKMQSICAHPSHADSALSCDRMTLMICDLSQLELTELFPGSPRRNQELQCQQVTSVHIRLPSTTLPSGIIAVSHSSTKLWQAIQRLMSV